MINANLSEVICLAVFAWVFCNILIEPGMILDKWWLVLNKLPEWLSKPFGACVYCFGGQLALWGYPILHHSSYGLIEHIMYIIGTIFIIRIINRIIWQQN